MKLNILFESDEQHTCPLKYRKPGDDSWARRNRKKCSACDAEYERELDAAFVQDVEPGPEVDPEEPTLGSLLGKDVGSLDWVKSLAARDPRRHHEAGQFGTGSPQAIQPDDDVVPALLKFVRDYDIKVDPQTGLAKPSDLKARCGYGHTCHSSPGKYPAWQYPMPDPLRTEKRRPGVTSQPTYRFNWMFEYDHNDTRTWPVSGTNGFKPKSKYKDYVESKLSCPVCNGEEEGCNRQVSHQYLQPKPFCDKHMEGSEYVRGLMQKLEDEPELGFSGSTKSSSDAAQVKEWERAAEIMGMRPGDRVYRGNTRANARIGTLVKIDLSNAPRTHEVDWDDIQANTYENPAKLRAYGPWAPSWRGE